MLERGGLIYPEDKKIVEAICSERNVQYKTKQTYTQTIKHYTLLFQQSFTSLLKIYTAEEEDVVWKKRTLKNHLITYRNYLYNNLLGVTAKIYFSKMLTILRHYEIELSYLPPLNKRNVQELPPITHHDLLTREELERAYKVACPVMRAIILFMSSSGCARNETLHLKVKDYLEANKIHNQDKPVDELLERVDDKFIPVFKMRRIKTNKYYITYCSPQANHEIKKYLQTQEDLGLEDKVFDLNYYYWNTYFAQINNKLKLGKVRNYNRFRGHMLRKFHASTLYNNGMGMEDVDSLQGRGRDSTHESYFMDDPELLKKKYEQHLEKLKINTGDIKL